MVTVAFDPEGSGLDTYYKFLQAMAEALRGYQKQTGRLDIKIWGYRHLQVDHGKRFASGKVYIKGLEGFWSYAKQHLVKFHGVSKEKVSLYLKEMEFRYNNRNHNLFELLVQNITKLVQNRL